VARFFEALVVFSAGLTAASCAGKSLREEGGNPGSGGVGGTAGSAPGTAGNATGGNATGGNATGGNATGGAAGVGGTAGAGPLPPATTLAQWNCSGLFGGCAEYSPGTGQRVPYTLAQACPVESWRPQSEADCAPAGQFTCDSTTYTPTGEQILVNCQCLAPDMTCSCVSDQPPYGYGYGMCPNNSQKICSCAYAGILR
jgi:hypothetical protein